MKVHIFNETTLHSFYTLCCTFELQSTKWWDFQSVLSMNHLSNLHEKESFVKSISDLKKLLVDTMYDYTKIIPSKLCVPSYLNLYVTLQNACELT